MSGEGQIGTLGVGGSKDLGREGGSAGADTAYNWQNITKVLSWSEYIVEGMLLLVLQIVQAKWLPRAVFIATDTILWFFCWS